MVQRYSHLSPAAFDNVRGVFGSPTTGPATAPPNNAIEPPTTNDATTATPEFIN
jgi:hypothetical protein